MYTSNNELDMLCLGHESEIRNEKCKRYIHYSASILELG